MLRESGSAAAARSSSWAAAAALPRPEQVKAAPVQGVGVILAGRLVRLARLFRLVKFWC